MRKIIILNVPSIPTMMLMIIWKHFSTGNAISPTASTQAAKTTTDSKESNSNNDDDDDDDKEHNSRNTTTQKAKTRKPTTGTDRTKNHLIQSTRPFYKSSTRKTTITKLESTPTKQPLTTASTNPQTSFGVLTGG